MINKLTTKCNQDGIAQIPVLIGILTMSVVLFVSSNIVRQRQDIRRMAQLPQPVGYCSQQDDGTNWDKERCCCPATDGSCTDFTDYGDRAHNPKAWCSCCQRHNGVNSDICKGCPIPCPDPYPTPYGGSYPQIKMTRFCVDNYCAQELEAYPNQAVTIEFNHQHIALVKACTRAIGGRWTDSNCNFIYSAPFSPVTVKTGHLVPGVYEVIVAGYNQNKEYSCSARAWYTGYNPPTGHGDEKHPPPLHCLRDDVASCYNDYFKLTIKQPEKRGCNAPCNGVSVLCEGDLTCFWTGSANLCRNTQCTNQTDCTCQPEVTPVEPTLQPTVEPTLQPTAEPSPAPILQDCEFGFEVP